MTKPQLLVDANCPDPAALVVDEELWLVCTTNDNRDADKFPIRKTRDLVAWDSVGHVFPRDRLPSWATADYWAPEIHRHGDGFICYFAARDKSGMLCLGAARASSPAGPWEDLGRPLLRDGTVGVIDAHRFDDGDARWLLWKADSNALEPPLPTPIYAQQLADDGVTLVGERTELMQNDLAWEGKVVEGPWLVRRADALYMFYAGNAFNSADYATGVARAPGLDVPFVKQGSRLLTSDDHWWGPGHGCAVTFGGRELFIFHAWEAGKVDPQWDRPTYPRKALAVPITWDPDGWPRLASIL